MIDYIVTLLDNYLIFNNRLIAWTMKDEVTQQTVLLITWII
jgi:hypothetical protein